MSIFAVVRSFNVVRNVRLPRNYLILSRCIGSSTKPEFTPATTVQEQTGPIVKRRSTNWKTYGFDILDQRNDIMWMHSTSFFLITLFLWGMVFILAYYPDLEDCDWAQREAHIELRRREVLGLPIIDKNYADPANIKLPPDEEIGEDEIII